MSKLRDSENIVDDDDGDSSSWQELNKGIKASTDNEEEQLSKLTVIVLEGVVNRLTEEMMMMIFEKKDTKHQENIAQKKRTKSSARTVTQLTSDEGGEGESSLMTKPKRQKTSGNEKKPNQRKRSDAITLLAAWGLEPPPDMPEAFKNRIEKLGGTDVKLVMQKIIHVTDLRRTQNRLSMPINQIRNMFWSGAEEQEKFKKEGGMNVRDFVEPRLKVTPMHLTKWVIGGSPAYVFNTQWKDVVKNNLDSLKPMAVVQIWSFRVGPESELGFAMIKVRDGEDGHQIDRARKNK